MSIEYALYEVSYANIMLYSATLPDYHGDKKEPVKADDPANKDIVKNILQGKIV